MAVRHGDGELQGYVARQLQRRHGKGGLASLGSADQITDLFAAVWIQSYVRVIAIAARALAVRLTVQPS